MYSSFCLTFNDQSDKNKHPISLPWKWSYNY